MIATKEVVTENPRKGHLEKTFAVGQEAGVIPTLPVRPHGKAFTPSDRVLPTKGVEQPKTRYRADLPIMVLAFRDNHQAAVTIQAGEIFEVIGPAEDDRFVVVDIKGEQFHVFEADLKDRGKTVLRRKAQSVAQTMAESGLQQE